MRTVTYSIQIVGSSDDRVGVGLTETLHTAGQPSRPALIRLVWVKREDAPAELARCAAWALDRELTHSAQAPIV